MKTTLLRVRTLLIAGLAPLLATGCLGPKVLSEYNEYLPAANPRVELRLKASPPADVLVLYDVQMKPGKTTRRAFYLFATQARLGEGKRPVFVPVTSRGVHWPIPILADRTDPATTATNDLYAVSLSGFRFRLESRNRELGQFNLPHYGNWLTAKKLFLFPLAAAADAATVGAAVGAIGAAAATRTGLHFTIPALQ